MLTMDKQIKSKYQHWLFKVHEMDFYREWLKILNITTQSVASPRTPHLSIIPNVTFTFELWPKKSIGFTMVT